MRTRGCVGQRACHRAFAPPERGGIVKRGRGGAAGSVSSSLSCTRRSNSLRAVLPRRRRRRRQRLTCPRRAGAGAGAGRAETLGNLTDRHTRVHTRFTYRARFHAFVLMFHKLCVARVYRCGSALFSVRIRATTRACRGAEYALSPKLPLSLRATDGKDEIHHVRTLEMHREWGRSQLLQLGREGGCRKCRAVPSYLPPYLFLPTWEVRWEF